MSTLMFALAGLIATAQDRLLARLPKQSPLIKRRTGVLLIVIGVWLVALAVWAEPFARSLAS